jgi:hypothetical protein
MTGPRDAASTEAGRAILAAADALVVGAASRDRKLLGARITAIGWATVDLERAERELGEALGLPLDTRPWPREPKLGARARVARPFGNGPMLILMEPDAEGRLAAILARHGEGVAMVIVEAAYRTRRLVLTSGPGGRPPTALAGRPPSAAG